MSSVSRDLSLVRSPAPQAQRLICSDPWFPADLWTKICEHLRPEDATRLELTCRTICTKIRSNNLIWQVFARGCFWGQWPNPVLPDAAGCRTLLENMYTGKCLLHRLHRMAATSEGLFNERILYFQVQGNVVGTCARSGAVRVWDLKTESFLYTLCEGLTCGWDRPTASFGLCGQYAFLYTDQENLVWDLDTKQPVEADPELLKKLSSLVVKGDGGPNPLPKWPTNNLEVHGFSAQEAGQGIGCYHWNGPILYSLRDLHRPQIEILDFQVPCQAVYPQEVLHGHAAILEKMAQAAIGKDGSTLQFLCQSLSSEFQKRLEQLSVGPVEQLTTSPYAALAIERLRLEVIIELLFHALEAKDLKTAKTLLEQAAKISPKSFRGLIGCLPYPSPNRRCEFKPGQIIDCFFQFPEDPKAKMLPAYQLQGLRKWQTMLKEEWALHWSDAFVELGWAPGQALKDAYGFKLTREQLKGGGICSMADMKCLGVDYVAELLWAVDFETLTPSADVQERRRDVCLKYVGRLVEKIDLLKEHMLEHPNLYYDAEMCEAMCKKCSGFQESCAERWPDDRALFATFGTEEGYQAFVGEVNALITEFNALQRWCQLTKVLEYYHDARYAKQARKLWVSLGEEPGAFTLSELCKRYPEKAAAVLPQ